MRIRLLSIFVVGWFAGCGDAADDAGRPGDDGGLEPYAVPVIEPRPTIVADGVTVLEPGALANVDGSGFEVTDGTVLTEGDVVVSLDGNGLARRVTGVIAGSEPIRYRSEQAALVDIYEQLTVSGTIVLDDEGAVQADTADAALKSHIPGGVGLGVTVPFAATLLDDAELGTLTLAGEASVSAGFQYGWDIGTFRVNLFYFMPWFEAHVDAVFEGDLGVVFSNHATELLRREFAPVDIPVGAPIPLRIVPILTVSTVLDGTLIGDARLDASLGLEAEGGAVYFADTGWYFPASADRVATLEVAGALEADVTIVPVRARMEFLIYGASGIFVEADVPAIDVDGLLRVAPAAGELRAVGRFRLGGGFEPGVFDRVLPRWSNDHIYDSEPYTIADISLGDGGGGDVPDTVGGTIACEFQRDFMQPGYVDEPYSDSYSVTLAMDNQGFATIPTHDVYGRPYHIAGRTPSGAEQSYTSELVAGETQVSYTLEYGSNDADSGAVRILQAWSGAVEAEAEATFFWSRNGDAWDTIFEGTFIEVRDGAAFLTQTSRCVATFC